MAWLSRFAATGRVLGHFYWTRMRSRRGPVRLRLGKGVTVDDLTVAVLHSQLHITARTGEGRSGGVVRLVSDYDTVDVQPDRQGAFDVRMSGSRHLTWHDEALDLEGRVRLHGPLDHLACALRMAADLVLFPLAHAKDLWAYFGKGDADAGARLELALLPRLDLSGPAPAEEKIPVAADGVFAAPVRPPSDLPTSDLPVTIIIPVYNAAEVLAVCLDHLGRNTPEPHRILLLDDASPDPRIRPLLADFADRTPHAQVLHNEANLGFVGTVNRGLGLAQGHVVLLNSDALVPQNWLSRLMAPIRLDPMVATVTPMSNDAEIFNAPVECRPLVLKPGQAEAADRVAARLDMHKVQADVPTGVGFCMAMARRWIDRVGTLDPVFGRGYGEEVDWCRRAAALGARHVGLGTLFVEHRSGSSFGAEKSERVQANNRIVSSRYPTYDGLVATWRAEDPLIGARLATGLALLGGDGMVPVYLAHLWGGGAEFWLQDRLAEDIRECGVGVVFRDHAESGRVLVELHSGLGVTRGLLSAADAQALLSVPDRVHLIYSCVVGSADPLGFVQEMVRALRPTDRLELLFHDFLPLCPSYCLVSAQGGFCNLPEAATCQSCYADLTVSGMAHPAEIADWRAGWLACASRANQITVFSDNSAGLVLKVWPELASKLVVRPHRPEHLPAALEREAPPSPGALTIGVLGGINRQKGAAVLHGLAEAGDPSLRLVLIGKIDPAFAHPAIHVHGAYDRAEISDLARDYGIDLWFIPSVWPETFCYTAHECLATGLPTFSFDLGAQADAMRAAENGHILPLDETVTRHSFEGASGLDRS